MTSSSDVSLALALFHGLQVLALLYGLRIWPYCMD